MLIRRTIDVSAGALVEIAIPISAGTGTYTETVNVTSAGAEDDGGGTLEVLRSNELQQLRGVITNDPMRAIHVLPGVATGDDLRSEFSVRGLPVGNMNFTFEGISTPLLVHTVHGVQDSGSVAMVSGDVLQEIALAAGSYPQRYGDHTGAELHFLMVTGEEFYADYDQRHTLNTYGVYRFSDRMSFSVRFRAGSNFPAPGYYEARGDDRYFLSTERNTLRVPVYTRLDVRANRTFTWQTKRLTLFVEALNLYDRDNVRAASPGINGNTHQLFGVFDSMFPRIPSAGLLLEF